MYQVLIGRYLLLPVVSGIRTKRTVFYQIIALRFQKTDTLIIVRQKKRSIDKLSGNQIRFRKVCFDYV